MSSNLVPSTGLELVRDRLRKILFNKPSGSLSVESLGAVFNMVYSDQKFLEPASMSSASGFLYLRERKQILLQSVSVRSAVFSLVELAGGLEVRYGKRVSIECKGKKIDVIRLTIAEAACDK